MLFMHKMKKLVLFSSSGRKGKMKNYIHVMGAHKGFNL